MWAVIEACDAWKLCSSSNMLVNSGNMLFMPPDKRGENVRVYNMCYLRHTPASLNALELVRKYVAKMSKLGFL